MDIQLSYAYREACTALGEMVVTQRLLQQRVDFLEAELAGKATQNGDVEPDPEAGAHTPSADHQRRVDA